MKRYRQTKETDKVEGDKPWMMIPMMQGNGDYRQRRIHTREISNRESSTHCDRTLHTSMLCSKEQRFNTSHQPVHKKFKHHQLHSRR
jgi:hypothetical protein